MDKDLRCEREASSSFSELSDGEGKSVMLIDDGSYNHIDVIDNIKKDLEKNFCPEVGFENSVYHGLQMAGIICGKNTGVAKKSKIIPVRVFETGVRSGVWKNIQSALHYALEVKPDVINLSLRCPGELELYKDVLDKLFYDFNIPTVWAYSENNGAPSSIYDCKSIISVSNIELIDTNYLPDIVLPLNKIFTTSGAENKYKIITGTSGCAALISAVICIIKGFFSKNKQHITALEIKNLLKSSGLPSDNGCKVLCFKLLRKKILEYSYNSQNLM